MRITTEILNTLEVRAERAIVQELRLLKKEVLQRRSFLDPDDQRHADALLLKLDRLESCQTVSAVNKPPQTRTPLRHVTTPGVLAVDEPVQELGVTGLAPVVFLATSNIRFEVLKAADTYRLNAGDHPEALELPICESNLRTEAKHGHPA